MQKIRDGAGHVTHGLFADVTPPGVLALPMTLSKLIKSYPAQPCSLAL
jgi:hypothetical protein